MVFGPIVGPAEIAKRSPAKLDGQIEDDYGISYFSERIGQSNILDEDGH